tara:strand:+ start:12684 stop:16553 length:3870 start_codon:yes stop_codon:yes gene_type:complete
MTSNLVKKSKFTLHKILLLLLFIQLPVWVNAQTKERSKSEREAEKLQEKYEKGIESWEKNSAKNKSQAKRAGNLSLKNFTRGGLHTGNLIQVPYITNVNISAGYWSSFVSPSRIIWPKGSGVEYGHTMSYMVGAEVQDDDGQNHVIVSESYNRSGGDTDPDGSHKYHFTPVPGYYNMYGDQSSTNKLNDNSTDRQQLESAGYYFVGGLSEDLNGNGELDAGEDLNSNNELDLVLENKVEFNAQSNVVETWPEFWPAQSYPGDDRQVGETRAGVRAGRWNGAYGSFIRADQESYYISDDRDNDEFPYYPFIDPATGQPDNRDWEDGGRRGIGIEIEARQYQWTSVLAEDIFVTTFDVKNVSRNEINNSIIAMLVDYDIGGSTGSNNALFDTKDDITYQWHKNNLVQNGFKVGYAGVGFLESPGISNDGIDNDADGMVDESRNDGIDNDGDWRIWVDVDGNGQYDNEDTNNNFILDPNEDTNGNGVLDIEPINDDKGSDGVGPEDENYPGPDPDGSEANGVPDRGEPNFEFTDNDEIDQIGLTNMVIRTPSDFDRDIDDDELFWQDYIQPSDESDFIIPTETADIIYAYSSGSVAINKNQSQRFSIAFFCGNDFDDMLRNKRTMQNIYDADYDFAKPPRRPFLTAVPDDNKVILVWDESAEISRDPIYGFDFEMYKIYRSTDPEFNDIKTITDAFGNPLLWEAVAQFDKKNGLTGAHPIPIGSFGISYDMGTDSGLEYRYIDEDVDNGRTYYYAVASVDQGYAPNFYADGISEYSSLASISPSESSKIIEVDAFERPVNIDRNTAVVVPQARATGYVPPTIENDEIVKISGKSTGNIQVDFLIPDSVNSKGYEYEISFTDDESYKNMDSLYLDFGKTTGFTFKNTTTGEVLAVSNPADQGAAIFDSPILNARIYDGMKIAIDNPLEPEVESVAWQANSQRTRKPSLSANVNATDNSNTAVPRDYEVRVSELHADTSSSISASSRIATNYTIWDVTYPNAAKQLPFSLKEAATPIFPQDTVKGMLSPGDEIDIKVGGVNTPFGLVYANSTWRFNFSVSENNSEILEGIKSQVNELYDSLAIYQVRDIGTRKYGADLSGRQVIDFLDEINTWFAEVEDSLKNTPGVNVAIAAFYSPKEYKEELDELFSKEMPISGDKLLMETTKPFNRDDVYRFKVTGNIVEEQIQKSSLDSIYVAPDPYIVVNPLEPRNTSLPGRGERRIDFRNLPQQCTIQVFTMSGRLVKTIEHNSSEYQSLESWDLKSDDGLDVAFGVYIYHVKAPGIGEKIGRFALIK